MKRLQVEAAGQRRAIEVGADAERRSLADLLRQHDLALNTRCGQRGLCDGCVVELVEGSLRRIDTDDPCRGNGQAVAVRGCEHRVAEAGAAATIRVPPRSLLAHRPSVIDQFKINVPWAHDPIEGPEGAALGAAIDLGTTTVALMLVDLTDGRVIGRAASFNKQMRHGDNVLTRINLCSTDPSAVDQLRSAVVEETIAPLLTEAMDNAGVADQPLRCLTVAGNSTMLHLLAGVDPSPMGVAPFTATFLEHRVMSCAQIGLETEATVAATGRGDRRDAPVHLLPGAAAYVGADLCAGIFSSGLVYDQGPCLLVDVGTNGEIIARHGDRLLGCATAAGPAFEGAGLACGIRAGDGAVSHLRFEGDPFRVEHETIGQTLPTGMCGTAYIDLMAGARRIDLLTATGRFNHDTIPVDHFVEHDEYGHGLRVAYGQGKRDIFVTEPDIASLLQAKAAIAAGILTLLDRLGLQPGDVVTLYLAGGFGMQMDVQSAIGCGLLPGFEPAQVQLVGNTSLAGAYLAMLDAGVIDELARVSKALEIIELNLDPNFEMRFVDMLCL